MPRQLEKQHDTDIPLPFLISRKGKGLFWNSAAMTKVNPGEGRVPINAATRIGTYIMNDAGDYVFLVNDSYHKDEIGVNMIASIWRIFV